MMNGIKVSIIMLAVGVADGAADVKDTISIKFMSKYNLSFQVTGH
jgi:hypothetical protein